ncbi:MAG: hypothetical protein ACE5JX_20315 [Acidobacteriota bacterium]
MTQLLASILTLVLGPLICGSFRSREEVLSVVRGFVLVSVSGLVLLYLLPATLGKAGWGALLFVLVGLLGPALTEHLFRPVQEQTHNATLVLGLIGLGLHAVVDGVALNDSIGQNLLPLVVILHRLPVSLVIWLLLWPRFGVRLPATILSLVAVSTVFGFFLGARLTAGLSSFALLCFQAFVAGSLLHVILHRPHEHGEAGRNRHSGRDHNWLEGAGVLLGIAFLVFLALEKTLFNPADLQEVLRAAFSVPQLIGLILFAAVLIFSPAREGIGALWSRVLPVRNGRRG